MKGKIIVIDGMDGVGKHTQAEAILRLRREEKYKIDLFSFPNYQDDSSFFVKKFLNGEYNDIKDNPYITSTFYSLDRAITWSRKIKELYDDGWIIILDRYYISNVLYQLHLLETYQEKMIYIQFLGIVEVESFKLPIPDLTILLYAQPEVSDKLINNRYNNDDDKRDIYENIETQRKIYNNIKFIDKYKDLHLLKNTLGPIETYCIHDKQGNVFSIENINSDLLDMIKEIIKK